MVADSGVGAGERASDDSAASPALPGKSVGLTEAGVPAVRGRSFLRSPKVWLSILVGAYFVGSLFLSLVRAWELHTTNWDLGIFQQALWTGSHGGFFYEAGDFETNAATSFLQVHPSLLMFGLAPIYGALPDAVTLLVIQSFVVALAAVPLFYITSRLTGSEWKALVAAGLYLVWTPTLSSNLYDFHLEAFLPVELLACFLFWLRRQYVPGVACGVLACVTFEVGPVFVFLIGLFFALPPIRASVRTFLGAIAGPRLRGRLRTFGHAVVSSLGGWIRRVEVVASLLLMAGAGLIYYALRYWETTILRAPGSAAGSSSGLLGAIFQSLNIHPANLSLDFVPKMEFWFLVFGLLAFIPVLAPRTFILSAPWIVFVMFSSHAGYWTLGFQTGLLLAFPLMVGVAYGLKEISFGSPIQAFHQWWATVTQPKGNVPNRTGAETTTPSPPRSIPWVWIVFGLIAANLALSPLNPYITGATAGPGYQVGLPVVPGYANAEAVAAMIPPNGQVLASDDLFPLVANDRSAYAMNWVDSSFPYLPFSPNNMPSFVLVSQKYMGTVPGWLSTALYRPTEYGVIAWSMSSPAGMVALFGKGFTGVTESVAPVQYLSTVYSGSALSIGAAGHAADGTGGNCSFTVESVPGDTGSIWYGPYSSLPPGGYTIQMTVAAWAASGAKELSPTAAVLEVIVSVFGLGTISDIHYDWGELDKGCYTITYVDTFDAPVSNFQVRGYQTDTDVHIGLRSVLVTLAWTTGD